MSKSLLALALILLLVFTHHSAYAQAPRFVALVNQSTFIPGETVVIYGVAVPNDAVVVRIFDPSGKAIVLDSVSTDISGTYSKQIFTWPEPSSSLPLGRYSLQVSSSLLPSNSATLTLLFVAEREPLTQQPLSQTLAVKLDSPTQVSTGSEFRIFIQTTLDGALVNVNDPVELLSSSHIHYGNVTINLADRLYKLHEGIYYADVMLNQEGPYIIHAIAFHRGFLAHDSKVITASTSTLVSIQETVNLLGQKLDATQQELDRTNQVLEDTRESLGEDVRTARGAVDQLVQASGQINSIIIPILALIAIVIALQISLFARIRASFK